MTFISGIMKQSTKIFMLYPMVLKSSLFQVVQKYKLNYIAYSKVGTQNPGQSFGQDLAFGQIPNPKQVFESQKRHFIEII